MKVIAEALNVAVKSVESFAADKSKGQFSLADVLAMGNEQAKANILALIVCSVVGIQNALVKAGADISRMDMVEIPIDEEMLAAAGLA